MGPNAKKAAIVVGAVGIAAGLAFLRARNDPGESKAIYRAWYAEAPAGPVIVVEEQTYRGPIIGTEPRRSYPAETTVRWFSHRLADGAYQGSLTRPKLEVRGGWKDRLWGCDERQEPVLLAADTLEVVADRAAIRSAVGATMGGDFEIRQRCYVDTYTGRLSVIGADGKSHWVTTDLRSEPAPSDRVIPEGWSCGVGGVELIEPREARCLSPASAPATSLALSRSSALAKDAGQSELLSGVSRSPDGSTKVLWTRSLAELSGMPEAPLWLGAHPIDPRRVVVMLRTGKTRVHVVTLDPTTGATVDGKVLFADSMPGP